MTQTIIKTNTFQFVKSWRLLWVVITLAVFALLIKLSFWQYQRGIEKQQRLERIAEFNQQQAQPMARIIDNAQSNNTSASSTADIFAQYNDVMVTIRGYFVAEQVFLLDNQVDSGRVGYKVYAIFFDEPSAQHVLVNLGWVAGSVDRTQLPLIELPKNKQQLIAHVRIQQSGLVLQQPTFSQLNWPLRVQQIDSQRFSQLIDLPLLPFSLFLHEDEQIGYKKTWQPIVMLPEKHFGYAVQWGGLAGAWLLLMLVASYQMHLRRNIDSNQNNGAENHEANEDRTTHKHVSR
ncbi:SURF1 family protein [Thalassotalea maritima]|uniref:SURF1 family protein n=1 Tax=Thalassotalea maritima TaxID=3242416 RepID=UPI0035297B1A